MAFIIVAKSICDALQRLSSLTFGTRPGRWLTLFVLLPFGGAFATIVFILEMMHLAGLGHVHHPPEFVGSVTGSAAAADLDQLGAMNDCAFDSACSDGLAHRWLRHFHICCVCTFLHFVSVSGLALSG